MGKWKCKQCAKCCKIHPIDISYSDVKRWESEKRWDILKEVSFINNYPKKGQGGFYLEKTLRNPKQNCPFLVDNKCSIHETLPLVCGDYPFSRNDRACTHYNKVYRKQKKLVRRQQSDLKRSLVNYNNLMAILVRARHM